jgi:hypothetical protein
MPLFLFALPEHFHHVAWIKSGRSSLYQSSIFAAAVKGSTMPVGEKFFAMALSIAISMGCSFIFPSS